MQGKSIRQLIHEVDKDEKLFYDNKNCCVYTIYFINNPDKRYIGSSLCFRDRSKQHMRLLKNKKHPNNSLQQAYNKNSDLIRYEIYKLVPPQMLHEEERLAFNDFKNRFNKNTPQKNIPYHQKPQKGGMVGKRFNIYLDQSEYDEMEMAIKEGHKNGYPKHGLRRVFLMSGVRAFLKKLGIIKDKYEQV